jgi:hypothetical protein
VLRTFAAALFALLCASPPAHATHQSGTLTPTTTSVAWSNLTLGGASADESQCVEDVNCEFYVLTLAPGDYTGLRIRVAITWLAPTSDWDLFVHDGAPGGPIIASSGDFVPDNEETGFINFSPNVVTTAKTYYVHVVAFAVAVPGYDGSASLVPQAPPRAVTYLPGNLTFSQNVSLQAPVAARDGEPSVRVDVRGNCYVGGIRGVPAGVDLWRFDLDPTSPGFDPGMQSPTYLGQPDAFLPQDPNDPTTGGADGGGDIDIAVSFPTHPDSVPVVTIVSLAAANISSAYSFDRGENFTLSPATVPVPADDRQWIEATGPDRVYMLYRAPIPATGLFMARSDDHGLTYPVTSVVSPSGTTPGYVDVDHTNGNVYAAHEGGGALTISTSVDQGVTWKHNTADNSTTHGILFDVVKVGDDGTVYACWSDGLDIYLAHSTDSGQSWSQKVRVNDNSVYKVNMFPWLEAGSAGRVAVVWYGTTNTANNDNADWQVLFSQSLDASSVTPTFRQQVISDHVIHAANISTGGLDVSGSGDNRNLIDYFQVAIDPQGAAVIAYTDDHNDFDGHTRVTRQLDGTSLYAIANGTGQVNPVYPPPLPVPSPGDPEVSDFLRDAVLGLLQPILADSPYDVLWVNYDCSSEGTEPAIQATMKVSELTAIPAASNWRMNFAANAPGGVSDGGDQFYFLMNSDNPAIPVFTWGTAVRNSTGGIDYTQRGTAVGVVDQALGTITIQVPLSALNVYADPDIATGSVLHGLRGSTFAASANGARDITRGGTSFTYEACGPTPALLSRFAADSEDDGIRVRWTFGPTAAVRSIEVERAVQTSGPWAALGATIEGEPSNGSTFDDSAESGVTYQYRLVMTNDRGEVSHYGPIAATFGAANAPLAMFLAKPSPNPARGKSSIDFQVGRPGFVELSIFDPSGRRIRTLNAGVMAPGRYTRTWDGRTDRFSDAPAGVYFYVLHTVEGRMSERITIVR